MRQRLVMYAYVFKRSGLRPGFVVAVGVCWYGCTAYCMSHKWNSYLSASVRLDASSSGGDLSENRVTLG